MATNTKVMTDGSNPAAPELVRKVHKGRHNEVAWVEYDRPAPRSGPPSGSSSPPAGAPGIQRS